MNDTIFFVVGISLVVAALVVSFLGIRSSRFPASGPLMAGVAAVFVLLVVATATFGWRNAADEKEHRQAELAAASQEAENQGDSAEALEEEGSNAPTTTTASTADGKQVFETAGCTGCHTLADAGSTATTGPNLDGALKGKPVTFIKTSIVDPSAEIEKGYPPNVMPESYGTQLSAEELDALVQYLHSVAGKG